LRQARQRLFEQRIGEFAPFARNTVSRTCLPSAANCFRVASRVARLMAARALPVTAMVSQVGGGTCALERMISTSSPFFSSVTSGVMRPLILQPTQVLPMLV
jgi:hypothetical protein